MTLVISLSLSLSFSLYAGDLWQARITKLDNFISQPRLILSTINRAYSVRLCYLMRAKFSRFPRGGKKKKWKEPRWDISSRPSAHFLDFMRKERERETENVAGLFHRKEWTIEDDVLRQLGFKFTGYLEEIG